MNWVTTNIRLPEDNYMELKMMAAQSRKSIAELVRNGIEIILKKKRKKRKPNVIKMLRKLDKLARENAKYFRGKNAAEALIEMRYKQ